MSQAVAVLKFTCLPPKEAPRGTTKKELSVLSLSIRGWVDGGDSAFGPCSTLIVDYGSPAFYLVEETTEEIADLMEKACGFTGQPIEFFSIEKEPEHSRPRIVTT
jgi:hypothetical protein